MALPLIKTTYTVDEETMRLLDQLAARWETSRSDALRRAIRDSARGAGVSDRLAALEALQASMKLTPEAADKWIEELRAERRASSIKSLKRLKRPRSR